MHGQAEDLGDQAFRRAAAGRTHGHAPPVGGVEVRRGRVVDGRPYAGVAQGRLDPIAIRPADDVLVEDVGAIRRARLS